MADIGNDVLIDGKSLFSLRVVDLKQELKKRGIKANGSKAQLQDLLIYHLNKSDDKTDQNENFKQSDDEISQQITEPSDSSPGNETTNALSVDDEDSHQRCHSNDLSEQNDEPTDLTKESAITSSVSINEEKNSIKLTIKLQPNDQTSKQLSPRKEMKTLDLSPEKEIKSLDLSPKNDAKPQDLSTEKVTKTLDLSPNKEIKTQELSPRKDKKEIRTSLPTIQEIETSKPVNEIREQTPEPRDLSVEKGNNEIAMDLSSTEVKETVEKPAEELSDKVVDSSNLSAEKEVITESVNKEEKSSVVVAEESAAHSQSSIETNKPLAEPSVLSIEKKVITTTLTVIEEKERIKPESNDKMNERNSGRSDRSSEKVINENNSLESSAKIEKVKPPRKRRWGSTTTANTTTNDSQQITNKGISSDQLKELIPDLNSTFSSAITSYTTTIATTVTSKVSKSESSILSSNSIRPQSSPAISEIPSKRDIRVVRKQVSIPEEDSAPVIEESKPSIPKVEPKKIVAKIEEELTENEKNELKREVSPAKNVETNIVFIRNLVRPFTLLQLKDVLGKTGKLIEQQFWIDKIKSKCFATYDTVSEAIATREALHGMRWPASNPKLLCVDFATKEELDSHLNAEIGINKEDVVINNNKINENAVKEKYDIIIKTDTDKSVIREKNDNNDNLRNRIENRPIREWDREKLINKEDVNKSRTPVKRRLRSPSPRSRSQERTDIKRKRHDSTKGGERIRESDQLAGEGPTSGTAQDIESPAKLLDDLFKKTTATPSIYWLPLTEVQMVSRDALKVELDKKRLEERNAREEQFRKRQEGFQNERRGMEGEPPFRNERGQWRPNSPNRRNFGARRMSPTRRPSPVRRSPPVRRSSPVRRSPSRRQFPPRYSRSPVNRRSSPRRKR